MDRDGLMRKIGRRVRELRKGMNLTLAGLAEKTGLSLALFSRIENGTLMPSIDTLQAIGDVLKVEVEVFFRKDESSGFVISYAGKRRVMKIRNGPASAEDLVDGMENPFMEPFITHLPGRGEEGQGNAVSHEGQEFCYVLEGKIELMLGEKTFTLKKGDSAYWNGSISHEARSARKEGATLLNVHLIPGKRTPGE